MCTDLADQDLWLQVWAIGTRVSTAMAPKMKAAAKPAARKANAKKVDIGPPVVKEIKGAVRPRGSEKVTLSIDCRLDCERLGGPLAKLSDANLGRVLRGAMRAIVDHTTTKFEINVDGSPAYVVRQSDTEQKEKMWALIIEEPLSEVE